MATPNSTGEIRAHIAVLGGGQLPGIAGEVRWLALDPGILG